jgi:hypothetical protein
VFWNFAPFRFNFENAIHRKSSSQIQRLNQSVLSIDSEYGRYPWTSIPEEMAIKNLFSFTFKYLDFHNQIANSKCMEHYKSIDLYAYPMNFTVFKHKEDDSYTIRIDYLEQFFTEEEVKKFLDEYHDDIRTEM